MVFATLKKSFDLKNKLSQGITWNLVSFSIVAVLGIFVNILIANRYGAEVLGVFNQAMAFYIFTAQFAVLGIHFSVLKYLSQYASKKKKSDSIISSSVVLTLFLSLFVALFLFLLRDVFASLLKSSSVGQAIVFVIPGVIFFALNKLLLAVLNAFRHMKNYAFSIALRYILIFSLLLLAMFFSVPGYMLTIIISLAELFLFVWLLVSTSRFYKFTFSKMRFWLRKHFLFGIKILLSGTIAEINTRIDIIMLGIFTSDAFVGIYSMAAIIAEGFSQLAVVVRTNINPLITRLYFAGKKEKLLALIREGKRKFYYAMFAVGLLAIFAYPLFLKLFVKDALFTQSWPLFAILVCGLMANAGYSIFNMILPQTGYPGYFTFYVVLIFLVNALLNWLLIPPLGMYGAAIATSISFVYSAVSLKIFVKKILAIDL